jgi:hypothetical protein
VSRWGRRALFVAGKLTLKEEILKNVRSKLGALAVVSAFAAVFAGSAFGALSPTLAVSGSRLGADEAFGPTFRIATNATDEPVARFTVYVPLNWTLSSPSSPSSTIGTVNAKFRLADRSGSVVAGKGSIVADTKGAPGQASSCDNATHDAAWLMNVTVEGQAVVVPMFVDRASGSEAAYASYRIVMCPPASEVAASTAGRAPLGAKLVEADFNVSAFTGGSAQGEQLWRVLATPFATGTASAATTGSVEAQSLMRSPTIVRLSAKHTKGSRTVTLSGYLKENGSPIANVPIAIGSGTRSTRLKTLRTVRTSDNGTFSLRVALPKTLWFGATASIPERSLGPNTCKATFGVPCVSATIGAARVISKGIKVAR